MQVYSKQREGINLTVNFLQSYGKFFTYELENKYLSQYQYQNDLTLLGRE